LQKKEGKERGEEEGKERGEERKGSQAQRARIQYFHFASA
jgi:hypothetical protein